MPFEFNKQLWDLGRQIEDDTLPKINKYFECDFKRNDNDIYDILDFKDDEAKKIVEIKGRRISSTKFEDTIITASKVNEGLCRIDDKIYEMELKEDQEFKVRFTGTNCIQHYMIPVKDLKEIKDDEPIEEESGGANFEYTSDEEESEKIN